MIYIYLRAKKNYVFLYFHNSDLKKAFDILTFLREDSALYSSHNGVDTIQ